jgi:hypothetical protein
VRGIGSAPPIHTGSRETESQARRPLTASSASRRRGAQRRPPSGDGTSSSRGPRLPAARRHRDLACVSSSDASRHYGPVEGGARLVGHVLGCGSPAPVVVRRAPGRWQSSSPSRSSGSLPPLATTGVVACSCPQCGLEQLQGPVEASQGLVGRRGGRGPRRDEKEHQGSCQATHEWSRRNPPASLEAHRAGPGRDPVPAWRGKPSTIGVTAVGGGRCGRGSPRSRTR